MAGVIQDLGLNLNLYLLIIFDGACSSNIWFILPKNNSVDRYTSCWSNWRTSEQSLSK